MSGPWRLESELRDPFSKVGANDWDALGRSVQQRGTTEGDSRGKAKGLDGFDSGRGRGRMGGIIHSGDLVLGLTCDDFCARLNQRRLS